MKPLNATQTLWAQPSLSDWHALCEFLEGRQERPTFGKDVPAQFQPLLGPGRKAMRLRAGVVVYVPERGWRCVAGWRERLTP